MLYAVCATAEAVTVLPAGARDYVTLRPRTVPQKRFVARLTRLARSFVPVLAPHGAERSLLSRMMGEGTK